MRTRLQKYHLMNRVPQASIADELGLSTPTYSRIVTGKVSPRIDLVEQIERITGGYVKAQHWYKGDAAVGVSDE